MPNVRNRITEFEPPEWAEQYDYRPAFTPREYQLTGNIKDLSEPLTNRERFWRACFFWSFVLSVIGFWAIVIRSVVG